jgi:hypothetical protein
MWIILNFIFGHTIWTSKIVTFKKSSKFSKYVTKLANLITTYKVKLTIFSNICEGTTNDPSVVIRYFYYYCIFSLYNFFLLRLYFFLSPFFVGILNRETDVTLFNGSFISVSQFQDEVSNTKIQSFYSF